MEASKIEWTDHTFNAWGAGKRRKRTSIANWRKPLAWDKAAAAAGTRPRVFCASLADWLDPEVPIGWLADLLALILETPNLDWLLLTKRPELWRDRMQCVWALGGHGGAAAEFWLRHSAPANVWLGTTVEDQRRADERIPALLSIPARVRFLSMEPLLEPVDLAFAAFNGADSFGSMPGIDWIIVGGESGPGARPCNVEWIRDITRQCKSAAVPVFTKQLGARPVQHVEAWGAFDGCGDERHVRLRDPKGGDPSEWPQDLRVREFPATDW